MDELPGILNHTHGRKRISIVWGLIWGIPVGTVCGIFIDWIEQSFLHALTCGSAIGVWTVALLLIVDRKSSRRSPRDPSS